MTSINPVRLTELAFLADKSLIGHIEKENEKTPV